MEGAGGDCNLHLEYYPAKPERIGRQAGTNTATAQ